MYFTKQNEIWAIDQKVESYIDRLGLVLAESLMSLDADLPKLWALICTKVKKNARTK